jgi:endonuclease/exonuclease/phosphatase family metal-dependent hydrolase
VQLAVGTFNLNNLFSRFNYEAEVSELPEEDVVITSSTTFPVADPTAHRFRTYRGRLVLGKPAEEREAIADRIARMDADVLAVQEVEDIDTLKRFNSEDLDGRYRWLALIEGNDPRLIDLALLSKLPLGAVTSWRHVVHPDLPSEPVFSRDLLQLEVLNPRRSRVLLRLFNNHLKSHYVPFDQNPVVGEQEANATRQRQAETAARIIDRQTRKGSAYVVLGDMNDPPDSAFLAPLVENSSLGLVDALTMPQETRPAKADTPPPVSTAWTHRFKETGQPARYELFDQIWLSPTLAQKQTAAFIDRRTRHSGDGSDHDPAWIVLDL